MTGLESGLAWLASLPQGTLVAAMAVLAAVENVFPPIPADVMVAFGAFLAARTSASAIPPFVAVWLGNMAGVALMYWMGRRYGTKRIAGRYRLDPSGRADARLRALHQRYGILALFLSRFIPGVRALVPPVAGALGIPFGRSMIAMGTASGLWYGAVTYLAFRAGSNWDVLRGSLARFGSWTAATAVIVACIVFLAVWLRRRRARSTAT